MKDRLFFLLLIGEKRLREIRRRRISAEPESKSLKKPKGTLKTPGNSNEWNTNHVLLTGCGSSNTHALESSVANIQSLAEFQKPFRPFLLDG